VLSAEKDGDDLLDEVRGVVTQGTGATSRPFDEAGADRIPEKRWCVVPDGYRSVTAATLADLADRGRSIASGLSAACYTLH